MNIEQLYYKKISLVLYLLVLLFFLAFIIFNYIAPKDIDCPILIKNIIAKIGVNVSFVLLIAPLSLMILALLFWVKNDHNHKIFTFTTSGALVDRKGVFYPFIVLSFVLIATNLISFYTNPENYIYNFKPIPFLFVLKLALIPIPFQTYFKKYFVSAYLTRVIGLNTKSSLILFLLTSILFGFLCLRNPEIGRIGYDVLIYYFGTAFFLRILKLMHKGLDLEFGFPAANNLIGTVLLVQDWSEFQTHFILKDIPLLSAGFGNILPFLLPFQFSFSSYVENWNGKIGMKTSSNINFSLYNH